MEPTAPTADFPLWGLDEDLLAAVAADRRPRVRAIRCGETHVVIGRGGRADLELRTGAIRADGVPIFRRRGGGCAVVLDPGNAVVSAVLPLAGVGGINSAFAALSAWAAGGLARLGLPAVVREGVSDLALAGRKLGGSCIYRTRGLLYYSTTLLLDPDLELVERYLPHPPREPEYRRGRPHRDFMTSVRDVLGPGAADRFAADMGGVFTVESLSGTGLGRQFR